jgi:RNA polymerase sigma-70 factor (ECF subfamily)
MITSQHDPAMLGSYVLGELDEAERHAMQAYLATCERCRLEVADLEAMQASLGEIPPEALLDGPPEDADLLLRRILREVAQEGGGSARRQRGVAALAVTAAALAVLAGGVTVGRLAGAPAPAQPSDGHLADARTSSFTDMATGARMRVLAKPVSGGAQLDAQVTGVRAGTECRLYTVGPAGEREYVGGWTMSARSSVTIPASSSLDPSAITAVTLETAGGATLVSVTF